MAEFEINAGAWFRGLSTEHLAWRGRRVAAPFTIESLGEGHRRLGRVYVVEANEPGEAFQRAYVAFAADSFAALSMPELESVSLVWQRPLAES
jgi:hypothetical protein